jgi:hypothetical protein
VARNDERFAQSGRGQDLVKCSPTHCGREENVY